MTKDQAFDLMKAVLTELLGDAQKLAGQAKNPAARRTARDRATKITQALKEAEEAR